MEGGSGQFCELLNKNMEKAGLIAEALIFTDQLNPEQKNSEGVRLKREVIRKRQLRT